MEGRRYSGRDGHELAPLRPSLDRRKPRTGTANTRLPRHCIQNPDEFAKVSELAIRFAIDPAAHDLDPIIAQRLAAMMFESQRIDWILRDDVCRL
jgi:hypothetical protein